MARDGDCPLCDPSKAILANELACVLEDRDPLTPGHCLVVPAPHVADFFDLTSAEQEAIPDPVRRARVWLDERRRPDGYNVGVNVEGGGRAVHCARARDAAPSRRHERPQRRGVRGDPAGAETSDTS
jgi:diadenosine tetraphosphate (Ap4A) HIT family hydrolase